MVASIRRNDSKSAFLSVGQRFYADDIFSTGGSHELTVYRLVRDEIGLLHIVLRDTDGREISTFVEQVELAIELGALTPITPGVAGLAS